MVFSQSLSKRYFTSREINIIIKFLADLPGRWGGVSLVMTLAGHLLRHPELVGHKLVLWEPKHAHRRQGGSKITFVDTLRKDTGIKCVDENRGLMTNKCLWRTAIDSRTLQPP